MAQRFASQKPQSFRNHVENVAIVGAGGSVGKFITEALLSQGKHKVTAITREDSDSKLPDGIHHIKKVSYDNQQSLVDAMRGQDALIITMKPMTPPDTQSKLIDAAVEAGVEYIMPNEYGVDASNESLARDTMLGDALIDARKYVEKIGKGKTRWLSLVCGFWYEFSLAGKENRYGFDFDKKSLAWFDDGNTKFTQSTWPQVSSPCPAQPTSNRQRLTCFTVRSRSSPPPSPPQTPHLPIRHQPQPLTIRQLSRIHLLLHRLPTRYARLRPSRDRR